LRGGEDRLRRCHTGRVASHHYRQRAIDRALFAAVHRRVEHPDADLPAGFRHSPRRRPDGAHVDANRPGVRNFAKTPSVPSATAATSGESGSTVTAMSASRTASSTVAAGRPP
jgi:hypothetical protein